jgi:nitroreductase
MPPIDPEAVKRAAPDHPVHELVVRRWSPYAFAARPVDTDDLRALFEAARWAASSYNEQPWSWVVATADDAPGFARHGTALPEHLRKRDRQARTRVPLADLVFGEHWGAVSPLLAAPRR